MSFLSKIDRRKLNEKVVPYTSDQKTLEVGAYGNSNHGIYFSNKVVDLIIRNPGVRKEL